MAGFNLMFKHAFFLLTLIFAVTNEMVLYLGENILRPQALMMKRNMFIWT